MKKKKISYLVSISLAVAVGTALPLLFANTTVNEHQSVKSEVPYCVTSPSVPQEVTFDGVTIDLRRYDRRERMDR